MWRLGKPIIAAVNGWAMGAASGTSSPRHHDCLRPGRVCPAGGAAYLQRRVLFTRVVRLESGEPLGADRRPLDAHEALRIGMINEVVPHDELMETARALAKRIALVPEPSIRLNKAISMMGLQAAGVHSGLLLEGALGALAHSSHNEFREKLFEARATAGTKAYLEVRDGPFQPEPMGPKSKRRPAK